jgi:hypothetical protein
MWSDPPTPPEYRGTALEWHLTQGVTPQELSGYLRRLPELGLRDRNAVLSKAGSLGHPDLSSTLLEIQDDVPVEPFPLRLYASALLRVAKSENLPSAVAAELRVVALETLAQTAVKFPDVLDKNSWRHIAEDVTAIQASPSDMDADRLKGAIDVLGGVAEDAIRSISRGSANSIDDRGEGPFVLLQAAPTERAVSVMFDFLEQFDRAARRLRRGESRADIVALKKAGILITDIGTPDDLRRLSTWLVDRLNHSQPSDDPEFYRETKLLLLISLASPRADPATTTSLIPESQAALRAEIERQRKIRANR